VTQNQANGSPGIGGGIYTVGTFIVDPFTIITDNHASTSGDNIGP
jgi:predicted outer membrane repeat protein